MWDPDVGLMIEEFGIEHKTAIDDKAVIAGSELKAISIPVCPSFGIWDLMFVTWVMVA